MFKTLQGPEGPQIQRRVLELCSQFTDDWYDLSEGHSKRKGLDQISCERTQFIGYLCEATHYAMHDIYGYSSSFYNVCKENDDNIDGKHVFIKDNQLVISFNLFNSLGLNIPYASQRASDFCWEVFSDIRATRMETHLWNIELKFDMDLILDHMEKLGEIEPR
jgi:hypothetical protein